MKQTSLKPGPLPVTGGTQPGPAASARRPGRLGEEARCVWAIFRRATNTFLRIDGAQWAGAFAFNAFFSLAPLVVLLVTIASALVDRDRAGPAVIAYLQSFVPLSGEMQRQVFDTIAGVIKAREQAGMVALVMLVWAALQLFTTLICATNRAWGTVVYNWWRLPLKSLALLGVTAGAILLGMAVPVLIKMARAWLFPGPDVAAWTYDLGGNLIPLLVMFLGLSLFYRLAPRRPTRLAEVWPAALCATVLLRATESLFVIYLRDFATLNVVYGALGGIMALLLWIFLSGCVLIFGACVCAGQADVLGARCHSPPVGLYPIARSQLDG